MVFGKARGGHSLSEAGRGSRSIWRSSGRRKVGQAQEHLEEEVLTRQTDGRESRSAAGRARIESLPQKGTEAHLNTDGWWARP